MNDAPRIETITPDNVDLDCQIKVKPEQEAQPHPSLAESREWPRLTSLANDLRDNA